MARHRSLPVPCHDFSLGVAMVCLFGYVGLGLAIRSGQPWLERASRNKWASASIAITRRSPQVTFRHGNGWRCRPRCGFLGYDTGSGIPGPSTQVCWSCFQSTFLIAFGAEFLKKIREPGFSQAIRGGGAGGGAGSKEIEIEILVTRVPVFAWLAHSHRSEVRADWRRRGDQIPRPPLCRFCDRWFVCIRPDASARRDAKFDGRTNGRFGECRHWKSFSRNADAIGVGSAGGLSHRGRYTA